MDEMKHRRLQELDRSDFEISEGEPDIRGWDVRNEAGLKIGEVEELIVDAQQKKVRYMVVDLDDKDLKLPDRKVLIPIGLAELHKEDDDVLLPAITVDQLSVLPEYDKDNLTDEIEQQVCTAFGRTAARNIVSATATKPTTAEEPLHGEKRAAEQERKIEETNPGSTSTGKEPAIGSAEYYGNFYQHSFFNDYNLYKNRQQESSLSQSEKDSDYERGLRLWELRNEGDSLTDETAGTENRSRNITDEQQKERIRDRRNEYEERRIRKRGNSIIIQRINDEGLQDG